MSEESACKEDLRLRDGEAGDGLTGDLSMDRTIARTFLVEGRGLAGIFRIHFCVCITRLAMTIPLIVYPNQSS
jgi:hypothetical protein